MSYPTLAPVSQTSAVILSATGSASEVASSLVFSIDLYTSDTNFLSGAADQVAYTYKMLGGDVLDIELTNSNVYAAYETALLEYSTIINQHQARNVLSDVLGFTTGTFDHDGELVSGSVLSSSLSGAAMSVMYPSFDLRGTLDITRAISQEANVGGTNTVYSASIPMVIGKQDYDLQSMVEAAASGSGELFSGKVQGHRITVRKVFYKTPRAMWRFYGYYGGLNAVGNLSTYGQYSDDSTFEVIPAWQNKLQAMAYEDNIYTRISHYSYEIKNNKLRLFPIPSGFLEALYFEFTIDNPDVYGLQNPDDPKNKKIAGVNNINTVPFANIPYENINSMGKHWIRRYALTIAKETLGYVRSKFSVVPIPGESITLNGPELLSQAKEEQDKLRQELKDLLDEVTYNELAKRKADQLDDVERVNNKIPVNIFVG